MQSTELEYITALKERLGKRLPPEEVEDILSDYREHFRMGRADGRSEAELCRSLGEADDVAREMVATHFVNKAGHTKSARNFSHAVLATLGLGLFNLVFVLVPIIVLAVLLAVIFLVGGAFIVFGPVAFVLALLQLAGTPFFALWANPLAGILFSVGITALGLLLIIGNYYLANFFYRLGIRYLKWNIRVIRGTEEE
ncbi:MAG: DUF1700 domain-containing protein [Methanoregulaceae archaeon]|nr:DUF1700 domain-containing protein [Methanoregulaceae archaeon]